MSVITWLEKAAAAAANFVKTEIAKIKGDVPQVEAALENASTIANNIVNGLKDYFTSPTGKTIAGIIENVPGVGPYLTDILAFLPELITGLGWAKNEFTKSPQDIVHDGITAAMLAPTGNIVATNLITLNAHLTTKISELSKAPLSIQAATSIAPAVYAGIPA